MPCTSSGLTTTDSSSVPLADALLVGAHLRRGLSAGAVDMIGDGLVLTLADDVPAVDLVANDLQRHSPRISVSRAPFALRLVPCRTTLRRLCAPPRWRRSSPVSSATCSGRHEPALTRSSIGSTPSSRSPRRRCRQRAALLAACAAWCAPTSSSARSLPRSASPQSSRTGSVSAVRRRRCTRWSRSSSHGRRPSRSCCGRARDSATAVLGPLGLAAERRPDRPASALDAASRSTSPVRGSVTRVQADGRADRRSSPQATRAPRGCWDLQRGGAARGWTRER